MSAIKLLLHSPVERAGSSGISGDHLLREAGTFVLTSRKRYREDATEEKKMPVFAQCDRIGDTRSRSE